MQYECLCGFSYDYRLLETCRIINGALHHQAHFYPKQADLACGIADELQVRQEVSVKSGKKGVTVRTVRTAVDALQTNAIDESKIESYNDLNKANGQLKQVKLTIDLKE